MPAIHKFKRGDVFDDRYTLDRLIGSGGFADVWKATDNITQGVVALKIYTNLDEDGIRDLAAEYTRMSQLSHSNILRAEHFDKWGNIPYLIMKVCEGGSLDKHIGKMSTADTVKMIKDIASGLNYLHESNIVHQDIKPANILIDEHGGHPVFVLSDFGISSKTRTRLNQSVHLKDIGTSMTETYAPPEKFSAQREDRAPDRKGDIFSLGISIYEVVTGHLPFDEISTGRQLQYEQVAVDFSEIENEKIRQIVESCMNREKANRPTADDIIAMASEVEIPSDDKESSIPTHVGGGDDGDGGDGGGPTDSNPTEYFDEGGSGKTVVIADEYFEQGSNPSDSNDIPAFYYQKPKRTNPIIFFLLGLGVVLIAAMLFFIFKGTSDAAAGGDSDTKFTTYADTFTVNGVKLEMMKIPGSTFTMGSADTDSVADNDEKPTKKVTIAPFYMSRYEVTQALWNELMDKNPSTIKDDKLPVYNVSWDDCQTFIKKLNKLTGRNFRLPTEAEWEYAAKSKIDVDGNVTGEYFTYAGTSSAPSNYAWFENNSSKSIHQVGAKQPNAFGLYDMSGNVIEWCEDVYNDYSTAKPIIDKNHRVLRGGYYEGDQSSLRATSRGSAPKDEAMEPFGFRIAL